MKKTTLIVVAAAAAVAVAIGAGTVAAAEGDASPSRMRRDVDAIAALGVTGVQARAVDRGRDVVATSGVADLSTHRGVPANGYFRIGSITKTFVATVVLQLAGEHRLSLDDTIERWLPGMVQGNGNDGTRITLRQLLQHTSGIHDDYPTLDTAADYFQHRYDRTSPRQIVARAMAHHPDFPPGTGWSYANTNYVLLGMVIEKVTGRPWYEEVDGRVIRPLKLNHTRWPGTDPALPTPHAAGYQQFEAGKPMVDVTRLVDADASGGILSTTADLNTFFQALLGGRLLHPAELAQMKQTVPVDNDINQIWPGARYGLGIFRLPLPCGGSYWMHDGGQLGFVTDNGVTDDGRHSVVVSMSAALAIGDSIQDSPALEQEQAATALVHDALCASAHR